MKPKVAFIGTGGTISSVGRDPLDVQDYSASGHARLHADEILALFPPLAAIAEIVPIRFDNIVSPGIGFAEWRGLVLACERRGGGASGPGRHRHRPRHRVAGGDGLRTEPRGQGGDAGGAGRVAAAVERDGHRCRRQPGRRDPHRRQPAARGMGVLVVLNDEIQAAREVTKTSTFRLQTFRSPDFGVLGHADADRVAFYRAPLRRRAPDTAFDIRGARGAAAGGHRLRLCRVGRGGGAGLRRGGRAGHRLGRLRPELPDPGRRRSSGRGGAGRRGGRAVDPGRQRPGVSRHRRPRQWLHQRRQPQPAEGPHPAGHGADDHRPTRRRSPTCSRPTEEPR